jgi:class 3 adenylate cyclase
VSLSTRITLTGTLLVVLTCGVGAFALFQSAGALERELLHGEAALARILGGLKRPGGIADFDAIRFFVTSSDRPEASLGLVYAIEVRGKELGRGALNPRLFASLGPEYRAMVVQGRRHVLQLLAAGKVDRSSRIRELSLGRLRLGFDLARIDRKVNEVYFHGGLALGGVFLVGVLLSLVAGRRLAASLRRVARQMSDVVAGDGKPHLEVSAVGAKGSLAEIVESFERVRRLLAAKVDARTHLAPYLGKTLADRLLDGNPLELAAEERSVAVMVIGFRGLSTLGGDRSSLETLRLTNEYMAPLIDAVARCNGVVTVWGFPAGKEPERGAIKAALAARSAAQQEARRQQAIGGATLEPCVGIASGRAVGGNLGSSRRAVYTVTGFAVELAMQTELQAKPGEILVNEAAFDKVRGVVTGAPCAPLFLDEIEEAVPLYRLEG